MKIHPSLTLRHFKKCKVGVTIKPGSHLGFNAIKMLKKISLALLTQVET